MIETRGEKKRTRKLPQIDMYAAPVPRFNIEGRESIMTCTGTVLTIGVILLTLVFAIVKFQQLMNERSPAMVNEYVEEGAFSEGE